MARGRMLDRSFTKSRKLNGLSRDHRLLYASILPFVDREGRHIAEPIVLKANVLRWTDFTLEEIAQGVAALADAELITLYANEDNEAILEYVHFLEYNRPNVKEGPSQLPGPTENLAMPCRCEEILRHMQATCNAHAPHAFNVNVNVNDKGEGGSANADRPTPEEAFETQAKTGTDPRKTEHRFRDRLRFRAGAEFTREHSEDIPRWSREHPADKIDELWEASKPSLWAGTAKAEKRRAWIFADLLNQDISPRDETSDALKQYAEAGL